MKLGRVRLQAASRDWCRADRQYYAEWVVLRGLQIDTFTKHSAVSLDFGDRTIHQRKRSAGRLEICLTRRRIGLITYYTQGSNSIGPMYLMNRQPIVVGSADPCRTKIRLSGAIIPDRNQRNPADETGRQSIGTNGLEPTILIVQLRPWRMLSIFASARSRR